MQLAFRPGRLLDRLVSIGRDRQHELADRYYCSNRALYVVVEAADAYVVLMDCASDRLFSIPRADLEEQLHPL